MAHCFCRQKENNLFKPPVLNVQSNYLDEQCITVDENDKPLRPESKRFCHSAETYISWAVFSSNYLISAIKRACNFSTSLKFGRYVYCVLTLTGFY
ncbi:unnamed protein product [Onchocerca flexuosa]|uniref:DUF3265 domain-containing protein n=1 Tax=Onchocerca flexuosa TaxID=387005 RepID=A0A183HVY4_9BILA|nr:unnamed protein product [Onchocerca flexuosa]